MKLPFEDNTFDAVYECEATAHAPDKAACYAELMRVVKPGGFFGSYEWCMTDKYDPNNAEHQAIKKGIEEGDGLPDIATTDEVDAALEKAGWLILEKSDRVRVLSDPLVEFYLSLSLCLKLSICLFFFFSLSLSRHIALFAILLLSLLLFLLYSARQSCPVSK
jgi:sterol 24-C-methyltransferase